MPPPLPLPNEEGKETTIWHRAHHVETVAETVAETAANFWVGLIGIPPPESRRTDGQTDTPRIHLDRHDFTMTEETPNKISISSTLPSRTIHGVSKDGMLELFAPTLR